MAIATPNEELQRPASKRSPLVAFLARRLLGGALVLLGSSVLIFVATNSLPNGVAETVLGRNATPDAVAELNAKLGLDRPLITQYLDWLGGIFHGDLGQSGAAVAGHAPTTGVASLIGEPLVNSAVLALIAFVALVPLALLLGAFAGAANGSLKDYVISYVSLLLGSIPEFVLGAILVAVFFVQLDLLPPVALVAPGESPLSDPKALVLPVLTLLGVSVGFTARQVRAGMVEAMKREYVTMAQVNGLPSRRVFFGYALRNALVPSVQAFAQTAQYLVGGIVVVEAVFGYPGIGSFLVQAVSSRDLPAVAGVSVVLAAVYVLINIAADMLVIFLVPKLRTGSVR